MAAEAVATRRRIIPRPRLTKLLDESPAPIKLLIAPAGYGKTTLAQQWLSLPERRDVWYRAGPAAADVAALAVGIALAASEIVPDAGKRMRERIRAVGQAEEDVDVLAELFAEDVQEWPSDAWLAIDDYQFAMESAASERFVELLTQRTAVNMVITSRQRPSWTTARRILYGEIQEVERRTLAMSEDEAGAVLGRSDRTVQKLLSQAAGWPAVIGLAALSQRLSLSGSRLPRTLYEYVADEVLRIPDTSAQPFAVLALAGSFDVSIANALLGERAAETLEEGQRAGIFETVAGGMYHVHPLLREVLEAQLRANLPDPQGTARSVVQCLLEHGRFDDAFDLAARFDDVVMAEQVLTSALDRLLREGRFATISRWLGQRPLVHSTSPVVLLAEAETEYRHGYHARSRELAVQAASELPTSSPLKSRALARAGQGALMASREQEALVHFQEAYAHARTAADMREALIGSYAVALELGLATSDDYFGALEDLDDSSPETTLRSEAARILQAICGGYIGAALERGLTKRRLVETAADPLASTAFLQALANALNLAARYDEANQTIDVLIATADRYRLAMPVPHARLNQAMARHGRREFSAAHAALNAVESNMVQSDVYLESSVRAIRARVFLSEGRIAEALNEVAPAGSDISSPALLAEYLAFRALVYAAAGRNDVARSCAKRARSVSASSVEARVIGACVDAITDDRGALPSKRSAAIAWNTAYATGNLDGLVCSYRAWPPLLSALARHGAEMSSVLVSARDVPLARRLGIHVRVQPQPESVLTPREAEVFELLRSGLTNRAIAETLVVSEATVKVHLRHIYAKLGVRTRAEAIARALRQ